ncbi:MAG: glycosyltransferase family 4 protein [Bacteroidales bacterium]
MHIGIIIARIGGIDGVALETEKWTEVLKKMGHEIYLVAGQFEKRKINPRHEKRIPELSLFSPESYWGQKKAFFDPDEDSGEIISHIYFYAEIINKKLQQWVKKNKIDLLISENASALPIHISLGLGIKNLAQQTNLPLISHDHDFAWERGDRYISPHMEVNKLIEDIFPLRLPNSYHAVINSAAQTTLKERYNRESIVIPNVMDFNRNFGEINDQNENLKEESGFKPEDILLFQITRIVGRKSIDVAIRLVEKLNDKRIKLIITGGYVDDKGNKHYNALMDLVHDLGLSKQVHFAYDKFSSGLYGNQSNGLYSLSDAYAHATACTYFSTYEGFGNAFVEAVSARRPIFVNNYKPVFWPDIGSKGFRVVMLENNKLTDEKVNQMAEIIYNEKLNREIGEYNYHLGKKYFSYEVLEEKLQTLFQKIF